MVVMSCPMNSAKWLSSDQEKMLQYFNIFLLTFVLAQVVKAADAEANCAAGTAYSRPLSAPVQDQKLIGPLLASFEAKDEKHCQISCHAQDMDVCYLFNYCADSKLCQLMHTGPAGKFKMVHSPGCFFRYRECHFKDKASCKSSSKCFMVADRNSTCSCPAPLKITLCTSDGWIKVNSKPVCLQTQNDSPGNFTLPYTGNLTGIRLAHISGGVTHNVRLRPGNWGAEEGDPGLLQIFVRDAMKGAVTPPKGYPGITKVSYKVNGVTTTDPQFTLPTFELMVNEGSVLYVWLGEDLFDYPEGDNGGTLCTDVYALYQ